MANKHLIAIALAIAASMTGGAIDNCFASPRPAHTHLYVMLGFLNASPGLAEFGARMRQHGIPTTVASYSDEESLAEQAINAYRRGALGSILIVGHSYGGRAAIEMAEELGRSHVPVRLMVTFDPTGGWHTFANVHRAVNFVPTGQEDHFSVIVAHMRDLTRDVLSAATQ